QGIITTWEDFERYQWPKPEDVNYRSFEAISSVLPDEMKVIGQYGDIFTQVWMTMGFEAFSFAQIEQPDLIEALFEKFGELIVGLFETMAEFDCVGALWYSDDIAYTEGLMVSPVFLRTYLFPFMSRIGAVCRERDIPFLYHSDGVLYEVLNDLEQCGVNALQPVEPKAMDIVELKKKVAGRFCLIGNVELDAFLCRGTPETVEQEVKRLIREVAPGGGYCLGSSNTVPRFVKKENYRAMIEAGRKYGRYPINVPM
ncbi:MAG TPA: uroporphyrinogen decarboxylase family protein, partial [bacterium]|nr:uroporphyrinogen decarboxylase family protein [bacterium]